MRSTFHPSLLDYVEKVRYKEFDWQKDLLYRWEQDMPLYFHSLAPDSLTDDAVQLLLDKLSQKYDRPPVRFKRIERTPDIDPDRSIYYSCEEDTIYMIDGVKTANLWTTLVIHEFTHSWLSHLFNFKGDGDCSSVITSHGAVFVRAYLDNLCDHFGLSHADMLQLAMQFRASTDLFQGLPTKEERELEAQPLYIANVPVQALRQKWHDIDFSINDRRQRGALRALAYLDAPKSVRTG